MMFVRCQKCSEAFSIIGDQQELLVLNEDKWRVNFPCVIPLCGGRADRIDILEAGGARPIPLAAFYRAVQGNGWVGEHGPAEPPRLMELLQRKRIVDMAAFPIGDPVRTIIRSLTLEDGTIIHFESSNQGACVFFVEEPISERGHVDAGGGPESGSSDRSEVGLSSEAVGGSKGSDNPSELQGDAVSSLSKPNFVSEGNGTCLGREHDAT